MSGGGWHWCVIWRASTRAPHDAQTPRNLSGGRGDSSRESESEDSEDSDAVGVLPLRAASQQVRPQPTGVMGDGVGRWEAPVKYGLRARPAPPAEHGAPRAGRCPLPRTGDPGTSGTKLR